MEVLLVLLTAAVTVALTIALLVRLGLRLTSWWCGLFTVGKHVAPPEAALPHIRAFEQALFQKFDCLPCSRCAELRNNSAGDQSQRSLV